MDYINVIKKPIPVKAYQATESIDIHTLEGTMHANKDDWIITGTEGETWPVKKEIFEKTYELLQQKTAYTSIVLNGEEIEILKLALNALNNKAIFSEFSISCFDDDGNIEYFTEQQGEIAEDILKKVE